MRRMDLELDGALAPCGYLGTHTNGVLSHTSGVLSHTNGVLSHTNGVLSHTNGVLSHVCLYSLSCYTCVSLFQTRVCMRMFMSGQKVCVCVCLSDALRPWASTRSAPRSTPRSTPPSTPRSMPAPAHMSYGVATTSRLLKIIGLFCKRAL